MPIEVTVAVVGDPTHPFETYATSMPENELARPYAQRVTVTLAVEEEDPLGSVLARAAEDLDLRAPWEGAEPGDGIAFVDFFRPEDETGYRRGIGYSSLTLVDDEGRARWNVYFRDVPYRELVRAHEAGVLGGDARRPYLILSPGVGNGELLGWAQFLIGLDLIWRALSAAATVEGALSFGRRVIETARDRLGRGKASVAANYLDWDQRGALPHNLSQFLALRPWTADELALRLGCQPSDAEAILWAYGFTIDAEGVWRLSGDESARLLQAAIDDLALAASARAVGYERYALERVTTLIETGEIPSESLGEDVEIPVDTEPIEVAPDPDFALRCRCGREECTVEVRVRRVFPASGDPDNLGLRFSGPTDHFDIDFAELGAILGMYARAG